MPTRWTTLTDLTDRRFYFSAITAPNTVWADLDKLDLSEGAAVRKVDLVKHFETSGDVISEFRNATLVKVLLTEGVESKTAN